MPPSPPRKPFQDDQSTGKATKATEALGLAFESAGGAAVGLGKAVTGAMSDAAAAVGRLGGQINNLTSLTGASSSAVQGLVHAFDLAGTGGAELGGALAGLQARMYSTTTGSVDAILAFGRLGVSVGKAGGGFRNVTDVVDDTVIALINVKDEVERTGKAAALGLTPAAEAAGRALRKSGGDAAAAVRYYNESKLAVKAFGAELSGPALRALDDFKDGSSNVGLYLRGLLYTGMEPVIEGGARLSERISDLVKKQGGPLRDAVGRSGEAFASLAPQFERLVQQGLKASPAVEKLSLVLAGGLSGALTLTTAAGEKLEKTFGSLSTVAAVTGGVIFAAFAPWAALLLAAGLAVDDVAGYLKGIPSVTGDILKGWEEFKDEFEAGDAEQAPVIKAIYSIGTGIQNASKAWDAFVQRLNNNTALNVLSRLTTEIDAKYLGGQSDSAKKFREDESVNYEAVGRLGFLDRAHHLFGESQAVAKVEALKAQIRAERADSYQSLPPGALSSQPALPGPYFTAPQLPVPTIPQPALPYSINYSSPEGGGGYTNLTVNQTFSSPASSFQEFRDMVSEGSEKVFDNRIRSAGRQRGVGQSQ